MKLSEAQQLFMADVGKFIVWVYSQKGHSLTGGELERSSEQAKIYAAQGKGIVNSNHTRRLAIDVNLFINGIYMDKSETYRPLGDFWKSLSPDNVWGGDFKRRDGNHFSRRYGSYPV